MGQLWVGVCFLLLCQCATQHETKEFEPFFRTDPAGYYNASHVYERYRLENKSDLNAWEKRRLQDLYEVELRQMSKDSARFAALGASIQRLAEYTQVQADKVRSTRVEAGDRRRQPAEDSKPSFADLDFKKEYFQAYRMWNRDENEQALERAVQLSNDPRFEGKLTIPERIKALNLQFRVAVDLQNLEVAANAYAAMRNLDDCSVEAAEAGFLSAVTYLGAGEVKRAQDVFHDQCDPDKTSSNQVKRRYWAARFREANGRSAKEEYERIVESEVPGYYLLLAHARLGLPLVFPVGGKASYRGASLRVKTAIHGQLMEAENSLKYRLRNDAAAFLAPIAQALREHPRAGDVPLLLYLAHLFQAAGLQIESMKVYSLVTEIAEAGESPFVFDFIGEMFPTPFPNEVSRIGEEWKVDPDFLYAIMRQESAFNPGAVSPANARGLMQLMPFLGGRLSKLWRYDSYFNKQTLFFAKENLKFATYHLQEIQGELPHPALMAAAYNAGVRRTATWWKRGPGLPLDVFVELIPVGETRNYVKLVLRNYAFYRLIRNGGKLDSAVIPMRLPDPSSLAMQ